MGLQKTVGNVHFTVQTSFNQSSVDRNTGRTNPNHESTVNEAEVLRLAVEGIQLLKKQHPNAVKGDKLLNAAYKDLTGDRSSFVSVIKGIHQINSKLHLTARIVGVATLHVWLSQTDTIPEGPKKGAYAYKAVGISATAPTVDGAGGTIVPSCTVIGIRRRNSISLEVLEAETLRIELEKAAEMERVRAAARAELEEFVYGNASL